MTSIRAQATSAALRIALVGISALTMNAPALAVPIVYQVSGTASGTLGTTAFENSSFVLMGVSDTDGAAKSPFPIDTVYVNPLQSFEVTIAGLGAANAIEAFDFFVNQTRPGAGFSDNSASDVFDFSSTRFVDYSASSFVSPVSVSFAFSAPFLTTRGTLSFSTVNSLVFTAREVSAVPEPDPSLMLAVGAAFLLNLRRRKERHTD